MKEKEVRLDQYNNDWYDTGAGKGKKILWFLVNALFFVNPLNSLSSLKVLLLRLFGAKLGKGVMIKPGVNIKYPWLLEVGNWVWIGEGVWIDNLTLVRIDDHVCLSQGAMLLTGNHNYKSPTFDLMIGEIHLEQGSWIGARSTVCPGVRVGEHAILAVGSVATQSLHAWTIYQGNPAVAVRQRKMENETMPN